MLTTTMEHLLNGAAALEGGSGTSSSSDEKSPRVETTQAALATTRVKYVRTEHGAVRVVTADEAQPQPLLPRDLKPIQPAPLLPPISSLTNRRGLPPSLQVQSTPPVVARSHTGTLVVTAPVATTEKNENLCRYRNKLCLNMRAVKRNGELHNLCEKHRAKANQNQRKLESKRRVQKRHHARGAAAAPPRAYQLSPGGTPVALGDAVPGMHQAHHPMHPLPTIAQLHRPPPAAPQSYPYPPSHEHRPPY